MREFTTAIFFLVSMLLAGCESDQTDPQLEEAFQIHQEAITVNKTIQEQLRSVESSNPEMGYIRKRLLTWEENLVEVPGFAHEHEHDHAGHHHHGPKLKVTPEHMLNIQKEFLDSIQAIQRDVQMYLH